MISELGFWPRFVLAVLATWRITHLLAREDGPGGLIARFRARLGSGLAGKLMDCFQCLSFWIAAPMAFFVCRKPLDMLFTWLALSGAACLLERVGSEPVVIQPISQEKKGGFDNGMLWSEARDTQEHVNPEDDATRHTTRI
ncbi:MAG: hypothetical protein L3J18_13500 [Candidatus Brocadia sp.]|jgi:hypothetical protein|uniref:DUF1360 domain-containing protein n=1 Tax=Candidatus Brocadia fulgida TaxID=380242 RepID=A0A0M2UUN2_9BACT|nr:MAG: hypothetical protein BROFUL_01990 [Candidatus Brocadia fulgida]MBV6519056.1 hypothetical protein [Candidatus Brocadia fulgida]MCC6324127.1 hypothetical protein [Candidatus Brocadia sp.]UJS19905.1 MAG: hypothetical protein L3J18_13500 [Candidatus Brocadia sp.]